MDVNSTHLSQRHLHALFSRSVPIFWLKTFSSCVVHKKSSRHRHQYAQARHVTGHLPPGAYSARWDHEYGRLAINSTRTLEAEHGWCFDTSCHSTDEHEFPATPRRADPGPPLLQQAREESDARASVYHSEREGHNAHITCRLGDTRSRMSWHKRQTSWDTVRSRERPVANERRRSEKAARNRISHRREQDAVHILTWRNNREGFAPMCVLMAPASRSGKFEDVERCIL